MPAPESSSTSSTESACWAAIGLPRAADGAAEPWVSVGLTEFPPQICLMSIPAISEKQTYGSTGQRGPRAASRYRYREGYTTQRATHEINRQD